MFLWWLKKEAAVWPRGGEGEKHYLWGEEGPFFLWEELWLRSLFPPPGIPVCGTFPPPEKKMKPCSIISHSRKNHTHTKSRWCRFLRRVPAQSDSGARPQASVRAEFSAKSSSSQTMCAQNPQTAEVFFFFYLLGSFYPKNLNKLSWEKILKYFVKKK